MTRRLLPATFITASLLAAALGMLSVCGTAHASDDDEETSKVNGGIDIRAGRHTGGLSTVNGGIKVGEDAVIGGASTVNGGISLNQRVTSGNLDTVNGGIHVEAGCRIDGNIHSVNGGLHIADQVELSGNLSNVNGGIHVQAAHISGNIDTASGGIDLGPNAHIDGGVHVEKDNSWFHFGFDEPPHIVIRPGTVVRGRLHFERKVVLYVSDRATVGAIDGATAIKFSGDNPPKD